ncbi:MAG TPA: sulfite exporter TauE/SafE family protein [Euzebya sp.]|nr:sulfite exporter TauE/SafE family protein [Euzebya sp.]
MLSSISPVGEHTRQQRWGVTVTAYLLGSVIGGSVVGALAGGIGQLALTGVAADLRLAALGVVALVGLALDATVGVPTRHRQVDERWLTSYRGWVYGGGFGLQLGTGVATIIPSSVVYALWIGALLTASVALGAIAGAVFGLVRGLPLLLAGRIRNVSGLRRALARMDRARPHVVRIVPAAQLVVGAAALLSLT